MLLTPIKSTELGYSLRLESFDSFAGGRHALSHLVEGIATVFDEGVVLGSLSGRGHDTSSLQRAANNL